MDHLGPFYLEVCYINAHVFSGFMPEDITTFGLDPILPAMATFHDITTSHFSDHETSQAILLLDYIHSQLPKPVTSRLHRDYVSILVSLKSKVSFSPIRPPPIDAFSTSGSSLVLVTVTLPPFPHCGVDYWLLVQNYHLPN